MNLFSKSRILMLGLAVFLSGNSLTAQPSNFVRNSSFEDYDNNLDTAIYYWWEYSWHYCKDWFALNPQALSGLTFGKNNPTPPQLWRYKKAADHGLYDSLLGFSYCNRKAYHELWGGPGAIGFESLGDTFKGPGRINIEISTGDSLADYMKKNSGHSKYEQWRLSQSNGYACTMLKDTLKVGQSYELSFWAVNMEHRSFLPYCRFSNALGAMLSTNRPNQYKSGTIENNAQFTLKEPFKATKWEKITFRFVADSNYRYLTLGGFLPFEKIKTAPQTPLDPRYVNTTVMRFYYNSFYFIDELSLTETVLMPKIIKSFSGKLCRPDSITLFSQSGYNTRWYRIGEDLPFFIGDSLRVYIFENASFVALHDGYYDTIQVVVSSPPPGLFRDTFIFKGGDVTLQYPFNGYTFVWNGNETDTTHIKTFHTGGTQHVSVRDLNCHYPDSFRIWEIDPYFKITGVKSNCEGIVFQYSSSTPWRKLKWHFNDDYLDTNTSVKVVPDREGFFKVVAQYDTMGYSFSDTFVSEVIETPGSDLPGMLSLCAGSDTSICVTRTPVGAEILWQDGLDQACRLVNSGWSYIINLDYRGCKSSDTMLVNTKNLPRFGLIQLDTVCFENAFSMLKVEPDTFPFITWKPGNIDAKSIEVGDTAMRSAIVAGSNGCVESLTIKPMQDCDMRFFLPNSFSPDGDGLNDQYTVTGLYTGNIFMQVYNSWGELIFEASGVGSLSWDGTYKGNFCPQGNYMIVLRMTSQERLNSQIPTQYKTVMVQLLR